MATLARFSTTDADFAERFEALRSWDSKADPEILTRVADIIADVRSRGDAAVMEYTAKFDQFQTSSFAELTFTKDHMTAAAKRISPELVKALETAAERVEAYAEQQRMNSWSYTDEDGNLLGQKITPLDRAGIYVPGGKAAYPSSVLMNAIPAKVAGVSEIVMVVPMPKGEANDIVLTAALIAGVDRVFGIGGAQAVAALAYGTESVPPVDKIVGPGNAYVAEAKRQVFGKVGIDMIAGPSEIMIICDGQTNPDWIAMDLFSQAEHDEDAQAILLSPDAAFLTKVEESIERLLPDMQRADIIRASLKNRGALIQTKDLDEAAAVSNQIAPEHLELSVAEPDKLVSQIQHAGAIFMGRYTAEALGDYCAGPNHVLPTATTARFSSPLGVYDFQKRSSLIQCSPEGADTLSRVAEVLATGEGLEAHARSAAYRIKRDK